MKKRIDRRSEDLQRWDIITVSLGQDVSHIDDMIRLLREPRTTYENARHIVRALGKMPESRCEDVLKQMAVTAEGVILGDVAEAFGRLGLQGTREILGRWLAHEVTWVREKASWAIRQLDGKRPIKPSRPVAAGGSPRLGHEKHSSQGQPMVAGNSRPDRREPTRAKACR